MNGQMDFPDDTVTLDEADDAPVVAWRLDEMDSDLDSVHSAWGHTES